MTGTQLCRKSLILLNFLKVIVFGLVKDETGFFEEAEVVLFTRECRCSSYKLMKLFYIFENDVSLSIPDGFSCIWYVGETKCL